MDVVIVDPGFQYVDQGVASSSVFVDSIYMRWPVEANTRYVYESLILRESHPDTRFRYRVAMPIETVMVSHVPDADVVNTGDATEVIIRPDAVMPHHGRGLIDVGPWSGDVRVQFSQTVAHDSPTVLKAGSWIRLTKLAGF